MKKYFGTKFIEAKPITRGEFALLKGWPILDKNDECWHEKGYLVKNFGGYEKWLEKDVFEEAYRCCDYMTFGLALEALKRGKKVARHGWNGKGMFLFLANEIEFRTEADLSCVSHLEGELVLPTIVMKTTDDHFCVGWLASQTDMLFEDWYIIEEE